MPATAAEGPDARDRPAPAELFRRAVEAAERGEYARLRTLLAALRRAGWSVVRVAPTGGRVGP